MEEDAGVKAPVTRLRRRRSVEQLEESKSPAVNTPSKRRGRKKPELELIDENTPENTTQTTKKTAIKDVIDPVEDKPVTPSRRSTRIKSNTSIVSETAVAVGSPRAKRATRRTSQVGSDNEAPVTPVRTTRRTRKDSASSVEKVDLPTAKPPIQITEVIVEEPESSSRKSTNSEMVNEPNQVSDGSRRSPRLMKKQNRSIDKGEEVVTDQSNSSQETAIPSKIPEKRTSENNAANENEDISEAQITEKDRLSISSSNLIKDLDTDRKTKKKRINLNKSTPVVALQNDTKLRNRTKSWTMASEAKENNFFSDNESTKSKIKSPFVLVNSASKDIQNVSLDKKKSKKKNSNSFVSGNESINIDNNKSKDVNEIDTDIQNKSNSKAGNENVDAQTSSLFEKEPTGDIKTVVVIEDSDSNSAKANAQDTNDSGDQCVPVVDNPETLGTDQFTLIPDNNIILNKSKNITITNNSCEPMDVDETIHDSLVIAETETNDQDSVTKSLIMNKIEVNVSNNENCSKSKSKVSLSGNIDKSVNENKSTLILSHLKNTTLGSPKVANKLLSKSKVDLDVTQENETNKKNLSLNYLTSTPLQQKPLQKIVMQVNTSIIASNNDNTHAIVNLEEIPKKQDKSDLLNKSDLSDKENNSLPQVVDNKMDVSASNEYIEDNPSKVEQKKINLSKGQTKDKSIVNEREESDEEIPIKRSNKLKAKRSKPINKISSVSSNDSDEDDEMSDDDENKSRESNILDDEAEDMGDDYESGDSRDESERRFEKENEILEKGETLTSENDLSNDSDYEKDSFIVSSNEEDNELLEGTEDDLSMSDNELKMTSKSKKKYDERKLKEQKMASREMYESRHKLNQKSEKVKRKHRKQLSSSESESSESEKESVKPKKINRMRLDSSHEASFVKGDSTKNISKQKTRLSESVCDDAANEKEITINNESIKEKDPLSQIKEEPKTPIKSANSTIAFVDSEDTNNDRNESTKTQTELMDPLQDSIGDEDSLSSENEDIMHNYDSVLNDLNKSNKVKTKTCDISLNLDKKSKKKAKTIVDELNLTQAKPTKKSKNKPVNEDKKEINVAKESGESSDSIDIHLLFSEDSNDSNDIKNKKEKANAADNFIPLKRTEAKSNIREDEDSNDLTANVSVNQSAKKSGKRKSQIDKITSDTTEDNNLSFFIDTEGTHTETLNKSIKISNTKLSINHINTENSDSDESPTEEELSIQQQNISSVTDHATNKSLNKSVTKTPGSIKKKPKHKVIEEPVVTDNSDSDAPMEVSYKKEKQESKIQDSENDETDLILSKSLNKSLVTTPASERKKKSNKKEGFISISNISENLNLSANLSHTKTPMSGKKKLDQDVEKIETADNVTFIEKSFNKSIAKTPASEKKKKLHLNDEEIENGDNVTFIEKSLSQSIARTPASEKKKKKSISHLNDDEIENGDNVTFIEKSLNQSIARTPASEKKKKKSISHVNDEAIENADNVTFIEKSLNQSTARTPVSEKKKSLSHLNDEEIEGVVSPETVLNTSKDIKKKRKSTNENKSFIEEASEEASNLTLIKTPNSGKKKKVSESHSENKNELKHPSKKSMTNTHRTDIRQKASVEPILNVSKIKTPGSHKKSIPEQEENAENSDKNSKKRKRKSSLNNVIGEIVEDERQVCLLNESLVINQKKKRKISQQETTEVTKDLNEKENDTIANNELEQRVEIPKRQKSKKRKERDDDEENNVLKVSKQNSYEKAAVPRLPTSLLKQLDDKPQVKKQQPQAKKPKLISTTEFIVEETKKRKAKPSNYLEESVYLNDDDECDQKKPKGRIINPKVLPFVPTASISNSGYTTNFKVNVVPKETKFVAQSNSIGNFKDDYLYNKKIKRQGSYELYKRNRNLKISKF